MFFLAGLVSVILVAGIAYLALSKNTSAPVRAAAIAALVLAGLALAACSLILFFLLGSPAGAGQGIARDISPVPAEKTNDDVVPIVIFAAVIVIAIVVIIIAALREQKRLKKNSPGRGKQSL